VMKVFLLFYMCHFAMGLTRRYKTTVFFTFIESFMGYDFTGGRIFDFPIDFSMGLTTVQR